MNNITLLIIFQCHMPIFSIGDMPTVALEYQNSKFNAQWEDAYCNY